MEKFNVLKMAYAICVFCMATAAIAPAQTFTNLVTFDEANGELPFSSLVQGTDGSLYGTTLYGGQNGYGTVFRVTPSGRLTTLYSFCAQTSCMDGAEPFAGLVLGTDENFYGVTEAGGADTSCVDSGAIGCGTVFKITRGGVLTTLYSFNGVDGAGPSGSLVQGADGNFYGTTAYGGVSTSCVNGTLIGCGTVFKMTRGGALTTLHSFDGSDGTSPFAALIQAPDGNFYGTTVAGGGHSYCNAYGSGCGTVFKVTPSGALTTLHRFNSSDGANPLGALIQASNGILYGTTFAGGHSGILCAGGLFRDGCGTVFIITSEGKLTTVDFFQGDTGTSTQGSNPAGGLIQATDGNFYGTNAFNGPGEYYGALFEVTPTGALTTLLGTGYSDSMPYDALVQATSGTFYGTATGEGGTNYGAIFSLSEGLGPFITTLPTSREVGKRVIILGDNLTGATSVTFNGTPSVFTVVSATEIATTVPYGATTGTVEVVTPSGTLSSNVPFRVLE